MESRNWAIGDSVVVKPGVTDPDTGNDISGWQGRIHAFYDEEATLAILWDSLTLKSISPKHIAWCEEEGLSWTEMNLSVEEVEPVAARDTEKDVTATIKEFESNDTPPYGTVCFGDFELQEDHTLLVTALSAVRMEVLLELVHPLNLGAPQRQLEPLPPVEKPVRKASRGKPRRRP